MPRGRVLFVDDNFICSFENCEFLRQEGFSVLPVYNAPAAFEHLNRHQILSALVTDIDLGPGEDGFAVARWARAAYPDLPVVFISGTASGRHAAEGVGGSEFVGKPCSPQQVADALSRVMHAQAA
ncbi:response regulator [Phenylobacterium sp.]|uniref:response regulator n=1 Tax=Phenylobacterium sp. TaxID=1871053 RepID=UPI00271A9E22|nr:response regulator [Phenylobacterium sp.]MDO8802533.1 response regulator [Phenylobacterium sp.]